MLHTFIIKHIHITYSRVKFGILLLLYLNPKKIQEIDRDYTFIVIIINQDK